MTYLFLLHVSFYVFVLACRRNGALHDGFLEVWCFVLRLVFVMLVDLDVYFRFVLALRFVSVIVSISSRTLSLHAVFFQACFVFAIR